MSFLALALALAVEPLRMDTMVGFQPWEATLTNGSHLHQITQQMRSVRDGATIWEIIDHELGKTNAMSNKIGMGNARDSAGRSKSLCEGNYRERVKDALNRVLNFYDTHMEFMNIPDHIMALSLLQNMNNNGVISLQRSDQLQEWTKTICHGLESNSRTNLCLALCSNILRRKIAGIKWTPLQGKSKSIEDIGHEKETGWSVLNLECMEALVVRCEVPLACELTMFDEKETSQFQLTHQLLHRLLAEGMECLPEKPRYLNPAVNTKLCAKMLQEAKLIFELDKLAPTTFLKDLFAEQVAFCGLMGFSNFFRADYLDFLLSFQSESDYGCFVETQSTRILTNDPPIQRKLTESETASGLNLSSGEYCKRHLTVTATMALSMFWQFMESNC